MKKYILNIVLILGLIFGACNDWLDVPSKTEVIDYEMFDSEQGFMDAMSGVYYLMADDALYGDMLTMTFLDLIARRFDVTNYNVGGLGKDLGEAGYFKDKGVIKVIDDFWKKGYNVIANVNSLLEQIDEYKSVFTYDNYRLIKGEALGVRAFMHFDLMRMFGRPYEMAGDTLTIPYVTKLSGKEWPLFYTEDEVMGFALRDLQQADSLLAVDDLHTSSVENSWINSRQQHFNRWAVYATMARIYHWKGDKEKALSYAEKVLGSQQFTFFTPPQRVGEMRDIAFSTEGVFSLYKDNLNKVYEKRVSTLNQQSTLYSQNSDVESIYETGAGGGTDYRFQWLWYLSQDPNSTFSRYLFYRYNGSVTQIQNLVTLIRLSEMYYIAAECSGNTVIGRGYLNEVRVNRGLAKVAEDISDAVFQDEIFKEYQKEFYCEGQLLYYYKRLNRTMVLDHDNATYVNIGSYVFPIPEDELELRKGITVE